MDPPLVRSRRLFARLSPARIRSNPHTHYPLAQTSSYAHRTHTYAYICAQQITPTQAKSSSKTLEQSATYPIYFATSVFPSTTMSSSSLQESSPCRMNLTRFSSDLIQKIIEHLAGGDTIEQRSAEELRSQFPFLKLPVLRQAFRSVVRAIDFTSSGGHAVNELWPLEDYLSSISDIARVIRGLGSRLRVLRLPYIRRSAPEFCALIEEVRYLCPMISELSIAGTLPDEPSAFLTVSQMNNIRKLVLRDVRKPDLLILVGRQTFYLEKLEIRFSHIYASVEEMTFVGRLVAYHSRSLISLYLQLRIEPPDERLCTGAFILFGSLCENLSLRHFGNLKQLTITMVGNEQRSGQEMRPHFLEEFQIMTNFIRDSRLHRNSMLGAKRETWCLTLRVNTSNFDCPRLIKSLSPFLCNIYSRVEISTPFLSVEWIPMFPIPRIIGVMLCRQSANFLIHNEIESNQIGSITIPRYHSCQGLAICEVLLSVNAIWPDGFGSSRNQAVCSLKMEADDTEEEHAHASRLHVQQVACKFENIEDLIISRNQVASIVQHDSNLIFLRDMRNLKNLYLSTADTYQSKTPSQFREAHFDFHEAIVPLLTTLHSRGSLLKNAILQPFINYDRDPSLDEMDVEGRHNLLNEHIEDAEECIEEILDFQSCIPRINVSSVLREADRFHEYLTVNLREEIDEIDMLESLPPAEDGMSI